MPIVGRGSADLAKRIAELRVLAEAAGREPGIPVSFFYARPDPEAIERSLELGVDRLIFALPPAGRDEVLPRVERLAELARRYS
jgi:hypothetical protein